MDGQNATSSTPPKSGFKAALEYTGIPASWLSKRPKLPSRNWLIFLSFTSSVTGLYIYDRQQCKHIRNSYIERVKHLADEPLGVLGLPRKVTVLGARWPGDEEYEQSLKYFRKYVKPILVAAAVDYDMIKCKRHGDLASHIAEQVRLQRRLDANLDQDHEALKALPTYQSPERRRDSELSGGIIIVGRPAFVEFMAGLKRGWTGSLQKVDQDELLAKELENDSHFDEPEEEEGEGFKTDDTPPTKPFPTNPQLLPSIYQNLSPPKQSPASSTTSSQEPFIDESAPIPPLPPILLIPFMNYIGFPQIPHMMWDFFNQRQKVRTGAEAAYRLVMGNTRPFIGPSSADDSSEPSSETTAATSDLDFDRQAESWYKTSLLKTPDEIEKAREKFYKALPEKLAIARAISRGTREMTKEEINNPPPSEVELRQERLKKEHRWRDDLIGWDIVKPGQDVSWDSRFTDALRIFVDPKE